MSSRSSSCFALAALATLAADRALALPMWHGWHGGGFGHPPPSHPYPVYDSYEVEPVEPPTQPQGAVTITHIDLNKELALSQLRLEARTWRSYYQRGRRSEAEKARDEEELKARLALMTPQEIEAKAKEQAEWRDHANPKRRLRQAEKNKQKKGEGSSSGAN